MTTETTSVGNGELCEQPTVDAPPEARAPGIARRLAHRIARRVWPSRDELAMRRYLQRAGLKRARSIPTYTSATELRTLHRLALSCPPSAGVLEIGSYLGASTCHIAAALVCTGGTLTCVDTWQNQTMPDGEHDTYSEFLANVAPVRDRLTLLRRRSEDLTAADLGGPFHLIFLDGDHSYASTRRDFDLAAQVLAEDGRIAFHDSRDFPGVSRTIGEALASGNWQIAGCVDNLLWIRRPKWDNCWTTAARAPAPDPPSAHCTAGAQRL